MFWNSVRKTDVSSEKTFELMSKIAFKNEPDRIREMLSVFSFQFGTCVLTVIDKESRKIIETTEEKAKIKALHKTVMSLKELSYPGYYTKYEKNGIFFRTGYDVIRIYPLGTYENANQVLVVEQTQNIKPDIDGCLELLTVAVRYHVAETTIASMQNRDFQTRLPNRDTFLERLVRETEEENFKNNEIYIGMLCFINEKSLFQTAGIMQTGITTKNVSKLMKKQLGTNLYRYSNDKFAFILHKPKYDAAAILYNIMDEIQEHTEALFGASMAPLEKDVLSSVFKVERASEKAEDGSIRFVRELDVDEINKATADDMMYTSNHTREAEEKEAFSEYPPYEEQDLANMINKEDVSAAEQGDDVILEEENVSGDSADNATESVDFDALTKEYESGSDLEVADAT